VLKKIINMSFVAGFAASGNLHGIIEDFMGKEAWLEWTSKHWIDSSITMPIHIVLFVGAVIGMFYIYTKVKQ
jgi:hypothetical protein